MYAVTIICSPLADHFDEVLAACHEVIGPSRAEPGNLFFDVLVSPDRTELVFYEAYVDKASFEAHMQAPHTKAWQARALPFVDPISIRLPAHESIAPMPNQPVV